MADYSLKQLTDYLRIVAETECSVYRLRGAVDEARKKVSKSKAPGKRAYLIAPTLEKVQKPYAPDEPRTTGGQGFLLFLGIFFVVCAFFSITDMVFASMMFCISFVWFGCFAALKVKQKREYEENYSYYERELKEYREAVAESEKTYKTAMEEYETKQAEIQEQYEKDLVVFEERSELAKVSLADLENAWYKSLKVLRQLYELNIVYPKYQNMVAICTIYEYFLSGRCTTLEGHEGAYNLYESELRQNIIIEKLDTIVESLEQIKKGQYLLYNEMLKTHATLRDIRVEISRIYDVTKQIAETSEIAAICSQAAASNTQALKDIAILQSI